MNINQVKVGMKLRVVCDHPGSAQFGYKGEIGTVLNFHQCMCHTSKNPLCGSGDVNLLYPKGGPGKRSKAGNWWIHSRDLALLECPLAERFEMPKRARKSKVLATPLKGPQSHVS